MRARSRSRSRTWSSRRGHSVNFVFPVWSAAAAAASACSAETAASSWRASSIRGKIYGGKAPRARAHPARRWRPSQRTTSKGQTIRAPGGQDGGSDPAPMFEVCCPASGLTEQRPSLFLHESSLALSNKGAQLEMRGTQVRALVSPQDLSRALEEARVALAQERDLLLEGAALRASLAAWRVVAGQLSPSIPEIRRVACQLRRIEQAAHDCFVLLTSGRPRHFGDRDPWAVLAEVLEGANVRANLQAAIPPAASAEIADLDTEALLDRFIAATEAAREAVEIGVRREQRSRSARIERSRGRELGLMLIDIYVRLTGKPPKRSHSSIGTSSGELMRPSRSRTKIAGSSAAMTMMLVLPVWRHRPRRSPGCRPAWTERRWGPPPKRSMFPAPRRKSFRAVESTASASVALSSRRLGS